MISVVHAVKYTFCRRPFSTVTGTATIGTLGYTHYLEWRANHFDVSSKELLSLPRDHYDPDSIASYWEARPISAFKRLCYIAYELGPVAWQVAYTFYLEPWLYEKASSINLHNESSLEQAAHNFKNGNKQTTLMKRYKISNAEEDSATHSNSKRAIQIELSQKFRRALTNLGPTFIKIGQQLSIRPDLVSPVVLKELQTLCDAVPPFDCNLAMRVLATELISKDVGMVQGQSTLTQDEVERIILHVFEEIPKLVASASLGQVYKGKLLQKGKNSDCNDVAIKVQRPDILATVTLDLFLLVTYGKFVDKLFSLFTNQIPYHEAFLNGFSNGAYMELNYCKEAENQIFFRNELQPRFRRLTQRFPNCEDKNEWFKVYSRSSSHLNKQSLEMVIVPQVYSQYTTQRILVTEWIDGIPLAQAAPEQIRYLIPVGVEMFLCQLLEIGRFHADPHPGNLYVTKSKIDGVTPTLCLLDFGLVAHIDENARNAMTQAIINLLQGDYDTLIAHDAKHLGFLPHNMDVTELKPLLKTILKEGLVESGSNFHDRKRNLMAISNELNEVFFQYPFSVPPFFALVTRGLGLLEGIALSGDPSFDIFKASYPYAKQRAIERLNVKDYGKISRNILSLRFG